jgi:ComEC/Rec2-related protein
MLTGFSMSASRSVIMILFVYLSYLFIKECDSLTSLLCSVALIMLISPHSVMDVGLWLSFLATLGIITVYSPLSALWHKRRGDDLKGRILAILEKLAFALLLTFICNTFICLVVWQVFGEISTVSLIANPIISPLSEVFTLLVPIFVVLCSIPPLRYPLSFVLARFSEVISSLCAIFSSIKGAVISLEYDFAGIIIIIMSVALLVMLIIRLKRKWTVIIPPLAATLAFALCFTAHSLYNSGRISLSYFSEDKNDFLLLSSEGSSAICDISRGSYSASSNISSLMKEGYSTEISEYLITHYHSYHVSTTEKLMRREMLRRIYLPRPDTEKEKEIFRYISISAKAQGTELVLYEYGEPIHLLNSSAIVLSNDIEGTSEPAIALLIKNGGELFSYFSDGYEDRAIMRQAAKQSKYIVFGAHTSSRQTLSLSPSEETEFVFYANEDISERYRVKRGDFGLYMPKDNKSAIKLRVFLGD